MDLHILSSSETVFIILSVSVCVRACMRACAHACARAGASEWLEKVVSVAGCCEHGNEPLGSIKCENLEWLLRKGSAPWSKAVSSEK
jgi:hypothetical protein